MSGTENEAVEMPQAVYVGTDARTGSVQMWCGYCCSPILESGHGQTTPYLSSLARYASDHRRNICLDPNGPFKAGWAPVSAGLAATKEIVAREVIAGVCRREGHQRLDSAELELRCGRCGETWNEPRPKRASGGAVRYDFPEPGGCFIPAGTPEGRSAKLLQAAGWWADNVPGAAHVVLHDGLGNTLAVGDLANTQCPGCKRTIGRGRCSSAECPMARVEIPIGKPLEVGDDRYRAVPAPEPCPFTQCTQGPFGRDELNAHLAECPEVKVMQDRINTMIRRVDEINTKGDL